MERIPATAADLEALSEQAMGEIIAGELHLSPRPAVRHIVAATRLGGELLGPFDRGNKGPGGWILLNKPELRLKERCWCRSRGLAQRPHGRASS